MVAVAKTEERSDTGGAKNRSVRWYAIVGTAVVVTILSVLFLAAPTLSGGEVDTFRSAAQMRGSLVADHIDSITESGVAQQRAIEQSRLLQSRIEAGIAQQKAIASLRAFEDAWRMRGAEMKNHVEALTASGLAKRLAGG